MSNLLLFYFLHSVTEAVEKCGNRWQSQSVAIDSQVINSRRNQLFSHILVVLTQSTLQFVLFMFPTIKPSFFYWGSQNSEPLLLPVSPTWLYQVSDCPVGWGCRIHQLHLCRGVRTPNLGIMATKGQLQKKAPDVEIHRRMQLHISKIPITLTLTSLQMFMNMRLPAHSC